MRSESLRAMLFLSGFILTVGLTTIMVMNVVVSGDSTTRRLNNSTHQRIALQWEM